MIKLSYPNEVEIMSKILFYFKYIIMIFIGLFFIYCVSASTSKKEIYSTNENINKSIDLSTMALFINKEEEKREIEEAFQTYMWGILDSYTGDLTGYGAYCPLCTGHLACMSSLDLSNGRTTYTDKTYGEVRIVASSRNLPCGSIVRFNSPRISNNPTIAIVLDRGVLGNDLDLLSPSEDYALKYVGRSSITYDVLRLGWNK